MSRITNEIKQMSYPPPVSPLPSFPSTHYNVDYNESSSPSSSSIKISPLLFLIIVIFAVIFFIAGLLLLLVRFLMKRPSSFSPIYQSNRFPGNSDSHGLQRQLQQLFRLHDSGLDQSVIDVLPVFYYKDVVGLKKPFDCAVCLCEFRDHDKLRLLPICSHAFYLDCIDTWLLSNSTCPLCRATLSGSSFSLKNPMFQCDYLRAISNGVESDGENSINCGQKPAGSEDIVSEKRVFSVRLGKFRSINDGENCGEEISSCNLDARRCYSMGAYQYVVADSLQVTLFPGPGAGLRDHDKVMEGKREDGSSTTDGDAEEKRIRRIKGESLSVSKTWLWSKKSRFTASSDCHAHVSLNASLPRINGTTQAV